MLIKTINRFENFVRICFEGFFHVLNKKDKFSTLGKHCTSWPWARVHEFIHSITKGIEQPLLMRKSTSDVKWQSHGYQTTFESEKFGQVLAQTSSGKVTLEKKNCPTGS